MQENPYDFKNSRFKNERLLETVKKSEISFDELLLLKNCNDIGVQKAVLRMYFHQVSQKLYRTLYKFKMDIIRTTTHIAVLEYALENMRLIVVESGTIRRNIVLNPIASPDWSQLESAIVDNSSISSRIADSLDSIDIERLYNKNLGDNEKIFVLNILAKAMSTPQEILRNLSLHKAKSIRACVAHNKSTSVEVLTFLSSDSVPLIRELVGNNSNCTSEIALRLLFDSALPQRFNKCSLFRQFYSEDGFACSFMQLIDNKSMLKVLTGYYILEIPILLKLLEESDERGRRIIKEVIESSYELDNDSRDNIRIAFRRFNIGIMMPPLQISKSSILTSEVLPVKKDIESQQQIPSNRGHVYIAMNPVFPELLKIGHTNREISQRMKELSSGTGTPGVYICLYSCEVDDRLELEKRMHQRFAKHRQQRDREFFKLTPTVAIEALIELSK